MAIIGKIRERSFLLVGFVGLALIIFILSDLTRCSGPTRGNLGTIGGEVVNEKAYYENLEKFRQQDAMQAQQQQREYGEREQDQTADRAWAATVDQILLNKEYQALGLEEISDAEFNAYLYGQDGFTLLPEIAQSFTDSITGQFSAKELDRFIEGRESAKDPEMLKQWQQAKEDLRSQRKQEKYFQLLGQGVYVTKLEAKAEYTAQKEIKSISFVVRNFREIPDQDIKITGSEIRDFYEAHKKEKKYEVLAGRDVKYFDVVLQPSPVDSSKFNNELTRIKSEFAAAKNDSLFVNDPKNNQSQQRYNKVANPHRVQGDPNAKGLTYPAYMDTVFKSAAVGTVVGPYSDQGKTYLAKVLGFNTQSLSARHILLGADKKTASPEVLAQQKRLADSLAAILNADKTRFEAFVNTYSTDGGSKEKGGKYEDFSKDEFVPEFSNFVIANPVGKVGVVQSDFGYHIIEVLGKKDARIPLLAVIERSLVPSKETESQLKNQAYDLLYEFDAKLSKKTNILEKLNLFDTLARREGYFARPVRMLEEAPKVSGFNSKAAEHKIIQLAFDEDAEVGTLCSAPINDKGRYIIAIVSSIREEKGVPAFEDVYSTIRLDAIEKKKADKFLGQIGKERNLEKIARKGSTVVNMAEVTFANPSIQSGGFEPEIVGSLFSGLKDGATTLPLVGDAGVYVIRLNKTIKAPAATNYEAERKQMTAQLRGSVSQDAMGALRKKAEVYDNRVLTELGIFR